MGKKLKSLGEIGPLIEEFANDLLTASILETDARIKTASPVDTGRFRNSWMIGENTESGEPVPPGNYRKDVPGPVALNFNLDDARIGNTYSIHNNLEYAEAVAYGTSLPPSWGGKYQVGNPTLKPKRNQGVKPGFPDEIAKEMQAFVDQKAREVRNKF